MDLELGWEVRRLGAWEGALRTDMLRTQARQAEEFQGTSRKSKQQSLHSPSGQEASFPLEDTVQQCRVAFFIAAVTAEGKVDGVTQPGCPNSIFARRELWVWG